MISTYITPRAATGKIIGTETIDHGYEKKIGSRSAADNELHNNMTVNIIEIPTYIACHMSISITAGDPGPKEPEGPLPCKSAISIPKIDILGTDVDNPLLIIFNIAPPAQKVHPIKARRLSIYLSCQTLTPKWRDRSRLYLFDL